MDLKKTIVNFSKLEQENKKYLGDSTKYAFFRHTLKLLAKTLKLLAKISKTKITEEQPEQLPQEAGTQLFRCNDCQTDGYVEEWNLDKKGKEIKIIKDCDSCNGEGFLKLNVVDQRKKTKEKILYYDNQY